MTDYNKISTAGDIEKGIVNAVIEIPLGSREKFEWHRQTGEFEIDEDRPNNLEEPANYGFIPRTIYDDGDELDVLVIADKAIEIGSIVKARVIGVMKFEDEGVVDDKIITVPIENKTAHGLDGIPKQTIEQITNHFAHYKDYIGPKATLVKAWHDFAGAKQVIIRAQNEWERSSSAS
jgi:inorganic pyrophosphatase